MDDSKRKVLVLGLDGASPLLVNRWISELPTFKKFRDEGVFGTSIPPIPAQTPVAWTTFMTGKNPGKHGIFSFAQRAVGSYARRIASPQLVRSTNLWQLLSRRGKRVGVLNVPMSSFEGINGFMVPGFLDENEGIAQPKPLLDRLKARFNIDFISGDVGTEVLMKARTTPEAILERIFDITRELAEVSLYLVEHEAWDFFMTVFMGTDRLGHFFWKYVDDTHPRYTSNEVSEKVKAYYLMVDDILAQFLASVPEETVALLVSDHGFCPVSHEVFLNNYLQELGCLEADHGEVNLKTSQAIAYGYGDIWLNVEGREPHGIIDERAYEQTRDKIIDFFRSLRIRGEKPIQKVLKREDVYWGPHVREAPDLLTVFHPGWQAARRPAILDHRDADEFINDDPLWSGGHDGTHDPHDVLGILGFLGRNVKHRSWLRANLWDLTPTILKLMNVPIPPDMDGKPLDIVG